MAVPLLGTAIHASPEAFVRNGQNLVKNEATFYVFDKEKISYTT
jgi:hypothetical protein